MKIVRNVTLCSLLVLCSFAVLGCGQEADETRPIADVQAEADKMSADDLRSMAMKYKEAIVAKKGDFEKVTAKLKEIPLADKLGEEAKGLSADIKELNESISALKERFDIYYGKLKSAGGDLSGLQI